MEKITVSTVPETVPEQRIDRYLAGRFTYFSRSRWQKEIQDGRVLCNGRPVTSGHKTVKAGDSISYAGTDREEPPVKTDYSVIFEDDHLLAVNKPGNLPVHPSGCFFNNTLLMLLRKSFGEEIYPVHRLDRETSGLILFSKNRELTAAFQQGLSKGQKTYLAVVHGHPEKESFTVDVPIGNDIKSPIRKKRAAYEGAPESALTRFTAVSDHGDFSLLRAEIETGRQHQIRVHCLYSGLPIVGDKIYGIDETCYLEFIEQGVTERIISTLKFHRCALHSSSISLVHPVSGRRMLLESPLPPDFRQLVPGLFPS